MARQERTYSGILGFLQRLLMALEANRAELPQLEPFLTKLAALLSQALEINQQQAALRASKQEASRQLRRLISDGLRLSNVVLTAVREHYGSRTEKIAEFGLQPFRGRKVKPVLEEPESSIPPPGEEVVAAHAGP